MIDVFKHIAKFVLCLFFLAQTSNSTANEIEFYTKDKSCKFISPNNLFRQLNNINRDVHFTWTGKCEDGLVSGAGQLRLFEEGLLVHIENIGDDNGVTFTSGKLNMLPLNINTHSERYPVIIKPCIQGGFGRLYLWGKIDLESELFQRGIKNMIENTVNENCPDTSIIKKREYDLHMSATHYCNASKSICKASSKHLTYTVSIDRNGYVKFGMDKIIYKDNERNISEIISYNAPIIKKIQDEKIEQERIKTEADTEKRNKRDETKRKNIELSLKQGRLEIDKLKSLNTTEFSKACIDGSNYNSRLAKSYIEERCKIIYEFTKKERLESFKIARLQAKRDALNSIKNNNIGSNSKQHDVGNISGKKSLFIDFPKFMSLRQAKKITRENIPRDAILIKTVKEDIDMLVELYSSKSLAAAYPKCSDNPNNPNCSIRYTRRSGYPLVKSGSFHVTYVSKSWDNSEIAGISINLGYNP